jgi:hypothetical protein
MIGPKEKEFLSIIEKIRDDKIIELVQQWYNGVYDNRFRQIKNNLRYSNRQRREAIRWVERIQARLYLEEVYPEGYAYDSLLEIKRVAFTTFWCNSRNNSDSARKDDEEYYGKSGSWKVINDAFVAYVYDLNY